MGEQKLEKRQYIKNLYQKRDDFVLIGLTGRTGAGCTTTAKILSENDFNKLDLKSYKTCGFNNADERKYSFIYRFMKEGEKWRGFDVIEASTIIFTFVLEKSYKDLREFLDKLNLDGKINADVTELRDGLSEIFFGEKIDDTHEKIRQPIISDISEKLEKLSKENVSQENITFFLKDAKEIKNKVKEKLSKYTYEYTDENGNTTTYNLFVHFMQTIGNNIRRSRKYNDGNATPGNETIVAERIDKIIGAIKKQPKDKKRICIDALRNSVEIHYFRDRYREFYLFAVNTEDSERQNRLGLNKKEMQGLDKVEYPEENLFYHQNIQACLEIADVYLYNPRSDNHKNYVLTEQLIKYIALILQPGLVAPTHLERCMQLAFNAKYNSGCLSRKVGAVVTGSDFSIRSVGWNDVPKGQIACNLRCVEDYCKNKDSETFSEYELNDKIFSDTMLEINKSIQEIGKIEGKYFAYCFKDIKNGKNDNNQVHTRSLHAEENAFLQISKYGGASIQGGKLFTTASPCELCAKKAYQLGINEIYYIDPYPGLSQKHILSFGSANNPKMILFQGAIGNAYISMYSSRLPYKDELKMLTDINVKAIATKKREENDFFMDSDEAIPEIEIAIQKVKDTTELNDEQKEMLEKLLKDLSDAMREKSRSKFKEIKKCYSCIKVLLCDVAPEVYSEIDGMKKLIPYLE